MRIRRALQESLISAIMLLLCCSLAGQDKEFKPNIQKTDDGVCYLSTGVGYDSRVNLPHFSLRLVFSARTGKYLADIDLVITQGPTGKSTKIHSQGPWLEVNLAPGTYKVSARNIKGQEVSRRFSVLKNRVSQVNLVWDISDEEI